VLPGSGDSQEAVSCIEQWMGVLTTRALNAHTETIALKVVHHDEDGVQLGSLLPMPALPPAQPGPAPVCHVRREHVARAMLVETTKVSLLGALQQSLLAENRWRPMQMQHAQEHLDAAGQRLRKRYFRQRQTEITTELETLMIALDGTSAVVGRNSADRLQIVTAR
jgi:hypothetical protein